MHRARSLSGRQTCRFADLEPVDNKMDGAIGLAIIGLLIVVILLMVVMMVMGRKPKSPEPQPPPEPPLG